MSSHPKITEVTSALVGLLEELSSVERSRVVSAALMLLGEADLPLRITSDINEKGDNGHSHNLDVERISRQGKSWMKQNEITTEMLEEVFHIADDNIDIIATEIPGNEIKTKTVNAYVLQGISKMISSGQAHFDDKEARALCKSHGCYSEKNHATYVKAFGNKITGSKGKGWTLTAPGIKFGAHLIKEISSIK